MVDYPLQRVVDPGEAAPVLVGEHFDGYYVGLWCDANMVAVGSDDAGHVGAVSLPIGGISRVTVIVRCEIPLFNDASGKVNMPGV